MSDIEDKLSSSSSDNEEIPSISADIIDNDDPITTNIQSGKPKKPRTEKQLAALEKARATRKAKIVANKKLKEDHSNLIEENKEMLKKLATQNTRKAPKKKINKKVIYKDTSSEEEDEVIIVKKKPKKKKPIKKKIVYESSSSSSSEEEDNTISNDIQKQSIQYEEEPQYHYYSNKPLKYSDIIKYG